MITAEVGEQRAAVRQFVAKPKEPSAGAP
jgi:hypothetical protein